jgi:hypothetical protein
MLAPRRQERQVRILFFLCGPFDVAQDMLCAFARDILISSFVFFAPFAANSPVPNRLWLRFAGLRSLRRLLWMAWVKKE